MGTASLSQQQAGGGSKVPTLALSSSWALMGRKYLDGIPSLHASAPVHASHPLLEGRKHLEGHLPVFLFIGPCIQEGNAAHSHKLMPTDLFLQKALSPGLAAVIAGYEHKSVGTLGGASRASTHGSYSFMRCKGLGTNFCMPCSTFPGPRMISASTSLASGSN